MVGAPRVYEAQTNFKIPKILTEFSFGIGMVNTEKIPKSSYRNSKSVSLVIFELHFGSVYLCIYLCVPSGKFKIFKSAGILSLALVNKNWEIFLSSSIGLPPLSLASPVKVCLRVRRAPRAQWEKIGNKGWRTLSVSLSVTLQKRISLG